jgi:hypothetical protein
MLLPGKKGYRATSPCHLSLTETALRDIGDHCAFNSRDHGATRHGCLNSSSSALRSIGVVALLESL